MLTVWIKEQLAGPLLEWFGQVLSSTEHWIQIGLECNYFLIPHFRGVLAWMLEGSLSSF